MKTSLINPTNNLPQIQWGIGKIGHITTDVTAYIERQIKNNTQTECVDSRGNYDECEGEFDMEMAYDDFIIIIMGRVYETWERTDSYDYDSPPEYELESQYIEIESLECFDTDGNIITTTFDIDAFNARQYKNSHAA